ncbi:MAG: hypothetical protein AB7T07_08625 [Steroidobacteraceae bacterium]
MSLLLASATQAADVAAGKSVAQARCAACHEPADWQGETAASLQSLIRDVVSGKVKHSKTKVELNETDIANVTAYWLTGKK